MAAEYSWHGSQRYGSWQHQQLQLALSASGSATAA